MGTLKENFRKPWSSIYSTEKFSKMFYGQIGLDMEEKRSGGFKEKTLVIMYSPGAIKPCNHITLVWDGA
jgi:hypothetical protein